MNEIGELKTICEEGKRKNLTLQTTSCRIRLSNYLIFGGPVDKDRNLGKNKADQFALTLVLRSKRLIGF